MTGKRLAALRELAAWREKQARRQDVPPRTCLGDDVLRRVVREKPEDAKALAAIKGFPKPIARRRGPEVLSALRKGLKTPQKQCPRGPASGRCPSDDKPLVDELLAAGRKTCADAGLAHEIFGSRADYQELVYVYKHPKGGWPEPKLQTGWRAELAGRRLGEILRERTGP